MVNGYLLKMVLPGEKWRGRYVWKDAVFLLLFIVTITGKRVVRG